jgi:RIO kinase 1
MRDRKISQSVFDKHTIDTLYWMTNTKRISSIDYCIATGKEADVYRGIDSEGNHVALKIYRIETSDFREMRKYVDGDVRFDNVRKDKRDLVYAWCRKEFSNLKRMKKIGVRVPNPLMFKNNVLVMDFIGTNGKPAPLIKDIEIKNPKAVCIELLNFIKKLYEDAGLVHADLSEYNILYHKTKPVVIDVGQAVLLSHPKAEEFLVRDIKNISRFFRKKEVNVDKYIKETGLDGIYKDTKG